MAGEIEKTQYCGRNDNTKGIVYVCAGNRGGCHRGKIQAE